MKRLKILFLFIILMVPASCFRRAPVKDNPLDPQYINSGIITGYAMDINGQKRDAYIVYLEERDAVNAYNYADITNFGSFCFVKSKGIYFIDVYDNAIGSDCYYIAFKNNINLEEGETESMSIPFDQFIISPTNKEIITDPTPTMRWYSYPGASSYRIRVLGGGPTHYTSDTNYTPSVSINPGTYTVRLIADENASYVLYRSFIEVTVQ